MFRAGHAHAGVLVILSLVCQLLTDFAGLPIPVAWFVRVAIPLAAILMPLGFFLSVAPASATKPNGMLALVYLGAVFLAIGTVVLGIGLVRTYWVLSQPLT